MVLVHLLEFEFGVSTIKAFSDVFSKIPVASVSSLCALAYNIKSDGLICSLIDCKHNNCYCGVFRLQNGIYTKLTDYFTDSISNIVAILKQFDEEITFVGDGSVSYKEILKDNFNCVFAENNDLNSVSLGIAGFNEYINGHFGDSNSLKPMYLKPSSAEN